MYRVRKGGLVLTATIIPKLLLWATFAWLGFSSTLVAAATPAEAYARLPTFSDLALSHEGRYLAVRMNQDNRYSINVFDISGESFRPVYGFGESDRFSIAWFRWVSDDRLLLSLAFTGKRGRYNNIQTDERRLLRSISRSLSLR